MTSNILIKFVVSIIAAVLLLFHVIYPEKKVDSFSIIMIFIIILPWLNKLIDSAEFPGGWKIKFRELQQEQMNQKSEIQMLQFLVSHFLSDDEMIHLVKLINGEPFPFVPSSETKFFEQELRRLRAFGLIANYQGKGIRTMLEQGGDVKEHFYATDKGREYYQLRESVENS